MHLSIYATKYITIRARFVLQDSYSMRQKKLKLLVLIFAA